MPKQISYTLNENELKQIEKAMNDPRSEVVRRATAIHALHLGHKPESVAQMMNAGKSTISAWQRQWRTEGFEGLADKPKSGRPRKATPEYIKQLEETLATDPKDKGYAFTVWTQARLRQYLEQETGIGISRSRFQELLDHLGYVYRRPKRDLGQRQNPQLREQVKQALEELKKAPQTGILSYSLWTRPKSD